MNYTQKIVYSIIFLFSTAHCCLFTASKIAPQKETSAFGQVKAPQVTIVIIIDQFAYDYLPKLRQYFKGGLKKLLDEGIFYENAYHPHAMPATATGHAAFNTGAYAKDHGIIRNSWYDEDGNKVECNTDSAETAAVFAPTGFYPYGRSAEDIMVDGISDQYSLQTEPDHAKNVITLSLKDRAAICMAGRRGKAIWFDNQSGFFTSSKAFFTELPDWLKNFNTTKKINRLKSVTWKTVYPEHHAAYAFKNIANYKYTDRKTLIGERIPIDTHYKNNAHTYTGKNPYDPVAINPLGNQIVLDAAQACITHYVKKNNDDTLLLWISLSSLDYVGHRFGPYELEAIDMVYQLDHQIKKFMDWVTKKMARSGKKGANNNVLFVLSADHGVAPIPEILHDEGLAARRLSITAWEKELSEILNQQLGLPNLVRVIDNPDLYINQQLFATLDEPTQKKAIHLIKNFLSKQPGVKMVWTYDELANSCFEPGAMENFFRDQLYPGRTGQIIIQTQPNNLLTTYTKGTSHETPYNHDTHVPLVIYQKGRFEKKVITEKVWALQLANTLAYILEVPKPSASTAKILPSITISGADTSAPDSQTQMPKSASLDTSSYGEHSECTDWRYS